MSVIFEEGIRKIQETDLDIQKIALQKVIDNIRGVPENIKEKYMDYLLGLNAFYVFTESYMKDKFGQQIAFPNYNIYNSFGYCNYTEKLVIPIRGFDGRIKALCAYDNGNELDTYDFAKYVYSNDLIWSKNNYCFMSKGEFEKALTDGYVCIVDGVFDKITLSVLGINAVSLMSSMLSETNRIVLNFIPKKIVIRDNDLAGKKLLKKCQRHLSGVYDYAQGQEWDIDDYLKIEQNQTKFKENLHSLLDKGYFLNRR